MGAGLFWVGCFVKFFLRKELVSLRREGRLLASCLEEECSGKKEKQMQRVSARRANV